MRNTRSGGTFEAMVLPSLAAAGFDFESQLFMGTRPGGYRHKVDVVARKDGRTLLISCKWQQSDGTAETKVPWEIVSLAKAIEEGYGDRGYIVLGGPGWKLRDYFTDGDIWRYFAPALPVEIMAFEDFVARVNRGDL